MKTEAREGLGGHARPPSPGVSASAGTETVLVRSGDADSGRALPGRVYSSATRQRILVRAGRDDPAATPPGPQPLPVRDAQISSMVTRKPTT